MARITIEDCIENVPNRFHLVQMAAVRAKQLKRGATPLVKNEENKEVVIALREIAAGHVTADTAPPAELTDEGPATGLADEATVDVAPIQELETPAEGSDAKTQPAK
ncbi:MAG: DNA-directed RNA polymerase subunit omega [Deltaproteobacteria bacterium]|nr:DNA-directed RNA polymerase subunit omega [Deltaproteobacteria bacterium]